jgi:hypothetical protein
MQKISLSIMRLRPVDLPKLLVSQIFGNTMAFPPRGASGPFVLSGDEGEAFDGDFGARMSALGSGQVDDIDFIKSVDGC